MPRAGAAGRSARASRRRRRRRANRRRGSMSGSSRRPTAPSTAALSVGPTAIAISVVASSTDASSSPSFEPSSTMRPAEATTTRPLREVGERGVAGRARRSVRRSCWRPARRRRRRPGRAFRRPPARALAHRRDRCRRPGRRVRDSRHLGSVDDGDAPARRPDHDLPGVADEGDRRGVAGGDGHGRGLRLEAALPRQQRGRTVGRPCRRDDPTVRRDGDPAEADPTARCPRPDGAAPPTVSTDRSAPGWPGTGSRRRRPGGRRRRATAGTPRRARPAGRSSAARPSCRPSASRARRSARRALPTAMIAATIATIASTATVATAARASSRARRWRRMSSPSSSSGGNPRIGAAIWAIAARNRERRNDSSGDVAGPAQVEVQRLLGEPPAQGGGHRRRSLREVSAVRIPCQLAAGDDDEQVVGPLGVAPVGHLAVDPDRCRRLGTGEQDEVPRTVEGGADRGPQTRGQRQVALVTEHRHGAEAVPRLRQPLQPALDGRRDPTVGGVAVGDEGVVAHSGRKRGRARCRPRSA